MPKEPKVCSQKQTLLLITFKCRFAPIRKLDYLLRSKLGKPGAGPSMLVESYKNPLPTVVETPEEKRNDDERRLSNPFQNTYS